MNIIKPNRITNSGIYECMGGVDRKASIDYKMNGRQYTEYFEDAWDHMKAVYAVKPQPDGKRRLIKPKYKATYEPDGKNWYIDTPGVMIWDNKLKKYVKQYRMTRNTQSDWYDITLSSHHVIHVTNDYPFEVEGKGVVRAEDIKIGDAMFCSPVCEDQQEGIFQVVSVSRYEKLKYSYGVTTESEHFMVSGIYSYNC